MQKRLTLGLGASLWLISQLAVANGLFGFNAAPAPSNFSFSNGLKMYAGASAGYSVQGSACNIPFFKGECEDGTASWKAFGGVRINPMFGAELAYADLAKAEKSGKIGSESLSVENQISGYQLNAVGYLPVQAIPNLELVGKAGVMFWERETQQTLSNKKEATTDDGISPMLGLGAQYQLDQNLHLRGEWEQVFNTGADSDHESDASHYSVGFLYSTL